MTPREAAKVEAEKTFDQFNVVKKATHFFNFFHGFLTLFYLSREKHFSNDFFSSF